jgi:hypothetical protein
MIVVIRMTGAARHRIPLKSARGPGSQPGSHRSTPLLALVAMVVVVFTVAVRQYSEVAS